MFESSNLLSSEEISSKDVELKVEVCEPAGSRTDMWQRKDRNQQKSGRKTALANHKKSTTRISMVTRMIVARSQNLVKELQENVKEIYAALFFFPAKR